MQQTMKKKPFSNVYIKSILNIFIFILRDVVYHLIYLLFSAFETFAFIICNFSFMLNLLKFMKINAKHNYYNGSTGVFE